MGRREHELEHGNSGGAPRVAEAYRQHASRVLAFAHGRLARREDALDVTQEVFLRFQRSARDADLKDDEVLRYLIGIARHVVADVLAGRARWKTAGVGAEAQVAERPGEPELDGLLVEQCLTRLSGVDRTILTRYFYRGDSHRQIASSLAMTPEAVRQRFHRALVRLRTWLAESRPSRKDGADGLDDRRRERHD